MNAKVAKDLVPRVRTDLRMQKSRNYIHMYVNFGGRGLFVFRDVATFHYRPWTIVHGSVKI